MIKKDISKILTEGTPKQRLLILSEDRARRSFEFKHPDLKDREPILTDKEAGTLFDRGWVRRCLVYLPVV